jgi:hypothetical protein
MILRDPILDQGCSLEVIIGAFLDDQPDLKPGRAFVENDTLP